MKRFLVLVLLAVSLSGCAVIQSAFTVDTAQAQEPTAEIKIVEKIITATPPATIGPTATLASSTPKPTLSQSGGKIAGQALANSTPMAKPFPEVVIGSGPFVAGWNTEWFCPQIGVPKETLPVAGTEETIAEPGAQFNEVAWDHLSAAETPFQVPEAGFGYLAVGDVELFHNEGKIKLSSNGGTNLNIVIFRGLPDDGTPRDLNQIVWARNYVRGAGIYTPVKAAAFFPKNYTLDQVAGGFRPDNCGMGCKTVTITIIDLRTHTYRQWLANNSKDLKNWVRINQ